jgi:ABC-type amino acid transport substrate-binding protein
MRSRILAVVTVMLALAVGIATTAWAQSTLDTVKKRGKLVAGVKTDFPPSPRSQCCCSRSRPVSGRHALL